LHLHLLLHFCFYSRNFQKCKYNQIINRYPIRMPRNSSRRATSFSLYIRFFLYFSSSGSQASRSAITREARKPVLTKQIVTARQRETPKVCSTSLDRAIARSNWRWCRRWQLRIRRGEGRAGMWEGWFQIVPWDWVRAERRTGFWGSRLRVPRPITISPRLSLRKIKINGGISWGTNWKRRKRRPSAVDAVTPIYVTCSRAHCRQPIALTGLRVFCRLIATSAALNHCALSRDSRYLCRCRIERTLTIPPARHGESSPISDENDYYYRVKTYSRIVHSLIVLNCSAIRVIQIFHYAEQSVLAFAFCDR